MASRWQLDWPKWSSIRLGISVALIEMFVGVIAAEAADTVQQVHGHLVGTPSGEPAEESKAAVNRGSGDRPREQSHGA
jgi:hypothetical protein